MAEQKMVKRVFKKGNMIVDMEGVRRQPKVGETVELSPENAEIFKANFELTREEQAKADAQRQAAAKEAAKEAAKAK